jgi:arylsulfatase
MSARAVVVLLGLILAAPAHAAKPNIVLILSDDMGYSDLGCYGGDTAGGRSSSPGCWAG